MANPDERLRLIEAFTSVLLMPSNCVSACNFDPLMRGIGVNPSGWTTGVPSELSRLLGE
jgi:hypothetical protein